MTCAGPTAKSVVSRARSQPDADRSRIRITWTGRGPEDRVPQRDGPGAGGQPHDDGQHDPVVAAAASCLPCADPSRIQAAAQTFLPRLLNNFAPPLEQGAVDRDEHRLPGQDQQRHDQPRGRPASSKTAKVEYMYSQVESSESDPNFHELGAC
jgi:hypothetical protein